MTDTSDHITCEKIFLRVTVLGTVLDFIEKIIVGRHRAHEQTKRVDERPSADNSALWAARVLREGRTPQHRVQLNEAGGPHSGDDEAGGPCARVGEQRSEAQLLYGDAWLGLGLG